MASIDRLQNAHRRVAHVLALLERLVERLNKGEALPNALLGDIVDFFREVEGSAGDFSGLAEKRSPLAEGAAQHGTGSALLRDMLWALESLERGGAGAAGAFVIASRQYISDWRCRIGEERSSEAEGARPAP